MPISLKVDGPSFYIAQCVFRRDECSYGFASAASAACGLWFEPILRHIPSHHGLKDETLFTSCVNRQLSVRSAAARKHVFHQTLIFRRSHHTPCSYLLYLPLGNPAHCCDFVWKREQFLFAEEPIHLFGYIVKLNFQFCCAFILQQKCCLLQFCHKAAMQQCIMQTFDVLSYLLWSTQCEQRKACKYQVTDEQRSLRYT